MTAEEGDGGTGGEACEQLVGHEPFLRLCGEGRTVDFSDWARGIRFRGRGHRGGSRPARFPAVAAAALAARGGFHLSADAADTAGVGVRSLAWGTARPALPDTGGGRSLSPGTARRSAVTFRQARRSSWSAALGWTAPSPRL